MSLRDAREEILWLEILVVYRCKVVLRNAGQTVLTQEVQVLVLTKDNTFVKYSPGSIVESRNSLISSMAPQAESKGPISKLRRKVLDNHLQLSNVRTQLAMNGREKVMVR
jgi:hypothetical protein